MTLADLYRYSNPNQQFTVHAESEQETDKQVYIGDLDDCPHDLLEQEVNFFKATDWNCVFVEICI